MSEMETDVLEAKAVESRIKTILYWVDREKSISRDFFEPFMHSAFDEAVRRGLLEPCYRRSQGGTDGNG